ncbi:MAG TPA: SMP-30/gluconolactonase/LRE family protein [Casimicrobiaceae bacterium]
MTTVEAGLVPLERLRFTGSDLRRPECVLCAASGDVYAADWRGGVTRIAPDGTQQTVAGAHPAGGPLQPNGIALASDGTFLVAHLGATSGGVFRLGPGGTVTPVLTEIDGKPMPPTNYVIEDAAGRLWITVSTWLSPRALGYRPDVADGFVVLVDRRGARIVADGLGYTNELALDPSGRWLWVNETFGRRLSRFAVRDDGSLGPRQTVTTFGKGFFPDGLAFDAEGHAWVVSIVSNSIVRVAPDGTQTPILEDADPAHVDWVEAAFLSGTMGRPHLDKAAGRVLRNISSIAFGGPSLRTAYLGCLLDERLPTFDVPIAGSPPTHWRRQARIFD